MDDEINFRQYFDILWRGRYLIAAVTIAAAIAAGLYSSLVPATYEAQAMILVAKPVIQIGGAPSDTSPGLKIGALLISDFPAETLVAFARSPAILRAVKEKVVHAKGESEDPRLVFSVQSVRNTNLVELKVSGRDPESTARGANEWASVVASESEALFSTGVQLSYSFFDSRLQEARQQLGGAESAQRNFNAVSQLALLGAKVNTTTQQISSYQARLTDISVALEKAEAELRQVQAQLRNQPMTLTLSKSLTTDPFLLQATSVATQRNVVELSKLQLESEELNPLYTNLSQARSNLSIQVAALRAERERVVEIAARLNNDLPLLRGQLASQQLVQSQLARTLDNAKQVHDVLLQRREEARVATAGRLGYARLVAPAVVPGAPVGPRKAITIGLGLMVGLILGAVLTFVNAYLIAPATTPISHSPAPASSVLPPLAGD